MVLMVPRLPHEKIRRRVRESAAHARTLRAFAVRLPSPTNP
jgi:hypothetical protein